MGGFCLFCLGGHMQGKQALPRSDNTLVPKGGFSVKIEHFPQQEGSPQSPEGISTTHSTRNPELQTNVTSSRLG